jgi:aspartyl-tRNA(Asn)/glutamyl-tRNA(Gln) amidotransferase subunit C
MEVNNELIAKLATLSKLEFTDEGREEIKSDLSRMLNFVDKLNEVDTEGFEPLIHLNTEVNSFREDVSKQEITQKEALQNAPQADSDYFKVPKVLEK